jgi:hypothetical protein
MLQTMDAATLRAHRLQSQRLTAPAPTPADVARHLLAVQAQDFAAGRWALGIRSAGEPTIGDVDRAFDEGTLVRSWTQRGTLHIVAPEDVATILAATGARQARAYGIGPDVLDRAERVFRRELAAAGRLTREEFGEALRRDGVAETVPASGRILTALSIGGVLGLGPVVPREGGVAREQYMVALPPAPPPAADPVVELLIAYLRGHGPATPADFAWWAGLPLGAARAAVDRADDRVVAVDGGLFSTADPIAMTGGAGTLDSPETLALPAFDEYVLSYADRAVALGAGDRTTVGPTANGMVRPVILRDGVAVGTWSLSHAAGASGQPEVRLFAGESDVGVAESVARALRFFGRV